MKAIRMAVLLMVVATAARGAETSSMVSDRYSAAGRMAIGTESGDTWYGNDSSHPFYCSVAGGSSTVSGTVAATQSGTWSVSSAARCPSGTHLESVRAAPSGANVSLTLTAMCPGGTCAGCSVENIDATNACAVAFNASDASEGRILYSAAHPTLENSYGSWEFESSVTSIRVATSGISDPESRTIGACDLQVTCCGQ